MDITLNKIAEFRSRENESAFFASDVRKNMAYMRYALLVFYTFNFLLVIFDYLLLDAGGLANIIRYSLVPRSAILAVTVVFFLAANRLKPEIAANFVTVFVTLTYATHLYMAYHFIGNNLTSEAMDAVFIMLCVTLVPNRWIINLAAAAVTGILFVSGIPLLIPGIATSTRCELGLYTLLIVSIISIFIYRLNRHKRMHYLRETQLELLSKTDPLTKSYNRLKCDSAIKQMCRDGQPFSVILFDVDNFKEINDTQGHMIGDRVLVEIAAVTRANIREIDLLARWGGDEFLIVLTDTTLEKASLLSERLRTLIAELKPGSFPNGVAASFGVTAYRTGDSPDTVIERADRLLYLAKSSGKNNIKTAVPG